jgi:hypothetical protein
MKTKQIKVSRKGGPSVKVNFRVPENDADWQTLAKEGVAARDSLAVAQLIVKAQAAGREGLDDTKADKGASEVQKLLDAYVYDKARERKPAAPKVVKVSKADRKNPAALLAALKAQGIEIDDGEE